VENKVHLDTFVCKLLLMSENTAGEITSPYTSMLYFRLFSWVKENMIRGCIKIAEKRHLKIQH